MVNVLDVTEKIGNFIEKYTGSAYNYTDPTAPNDKDYTQIGELFGFPIWIDNNDRYETEFLDFPSLADILQTLVPRINFEIKMGDCMVCLVISYNLPLIQYPPITICLAKPECKQEEPQDEIPNECIPIDPNTGIPDGLPIGNNHEWREKENIPRGNFCNPLDVEDFNDQIPETSGLRCKITIRRSYMFLQWQFGQERLSLYGDTVRTTTDYYSYTPPTTGLPQEMIFTTPFVVEVDNGGYMRVWETLPDGRRWGTYISQIGQENNYTEGGSLEEQPYRRGQFYRGWYEYTNLNIQVLDPDPNPKKPKPKPSIPPSIPSPETSMDCCEDIKKLLARVEKKVDSLVKVIKPEDFTKNKITIPANWIYPTTSDNPVVLEDIPDYLGAIARLFDRRTGAFPQVVKIKDTKPEEEGDQGDSIIVNSAADLQRATLEYLIASQASVGANQIMTLATLQESALTHYIAASMERKVQAIVEYLDFELDEKSEILKMACNPTAEPEEGEELGSYLPKLVKPYEQPIETINWKGGESLKDMLMDMRSKLIYAASAVTETRDPDKVVEQYLQLQRLLRLLNVREIDERLGVKDLKNFFDESEKGFPTSSLPKQFKDKPYGFGPTETPKFARLTSKSKKTKYKKPKPNEKKVEPGDNPNA